MSINQALSPQARAIFKVTDEKISGFFGPYRPFSNFHICNHPVQYENALYPSVENAYMAAKTGDEKERAKLAVMTPKEAKQYGKIVNLREDWDEVKLDIMYELNLQKYQRNPDLKRLLLETEDLILEETNWWNDTFWGVCDGVGENHLGKILMRIRKELRDGSQDMSHK